ncbi:hypothetical protein Tco_0394510 [Tanacetum coccineum]
MSSDEASSKVTYTEALPSPDYVPGPEEPEQALPLPDYIPGPEYPKYLAPSDEEVPVEDQPYVVVDSPIALSSGYITDSDPKEDQEDKPEDGLVDYPADRGDDDEDDDDDDDSSRDDADDKDEEEASNEEEEEEHPAPTDSTAVASPVVDPVPSAKKTKPFETDESAVTPPPPPPAYRTTARMSIRAQTPIPFLPEAEVDKLLAISTPPPSPLTPLSSPLPQIPSPPLPLPSPSQSLSLPSPPSPRPPLPASLFIPPPVDHREDIPKAELPPPKEVGYDIRDVWVDPAEAVEEVALTTLEGANARVTELAEDKEEDTQDLYALETILLIEQEALVSREAWAQSVGLSSAVHHELHAYRTYTQIQDYRIASQESLTTTLVAHISLLQGQLSAAIGQIQALQARDPTHADDPEGTDSSRVSEALANNETLRNSINGHSDRSHNSDTGIRGTHVNTWVNLLILKYRPSQIAMGRDASWTILNVDFDRYLAPDVFKDHVRVDSSDDEMDLINS